MIYCPNTGKYGPERISCIVSTTPIKKAMYKNFVVPEKKAFNVFGNQGVVSRKWKKT